MSFEMALIEKADGALTKRISLVDGRVFSDGSPCVMTRGTAARFRFGNVGELAGQIAEMRSCQAFALGSLADGLPDHVRIVTRRKMNGASGVITRTLEYFGFRDGPTWVLLDFDTKGMPIQIAGFWDALVLAAPGLARAARVMRASTSAGLFRTDTGEKLPASIGQHVYLGIADGRDAERFIKDLFKRCWLAGYGWLMLGAAGQMLQRSIVDTTVCSPERLVFEGAPQLVAPLRQDAEMRRPRAFDGEIIDTRAACPPLDRLEQARFDELVAKETVRLRPESDLRQAAYDKACVERMVCAGIGQSEARRIVEQRHRGILLPDTVLAWDDPDLAARVADVLKDPDRFIGETLADPIEGVEYGLGKAKVLRRRDGGVLVHSFAHGLGSVYEMKFDMALAEATVRSMAGIEAAAAAVKCVMRGSLNAGEEEKLLKLTVEHSGVGKRALNKMLDQARGEAGDKRRAEERERRLAERDDPRPRLVSPSSDAEWLPIIGDINGVLGSSETPTRNAEMICAAIRSTRLPSLHTLTTKESNHGE